MDSIISNSRILVNRVSLEFKRSLYYTFSWDQRLTGIIGGRGVGKTTLILQYMKEHYQNSDEAIYASLDNLYFSKKPLIDFVDEFYKLGGKHLLLDEVHKYPNWSQELKNIYDSYPDLRVTFTSSSALDVYKGSHDLTRRALLSTLTGLSLREYLKLFYKIAIDSYTIDQIFNDHVKIAQDINQLIKPIKIYKEYLSKGYYPFLIEDTKGYYQRINNAINATIENDIHSIYNIDLSSILKLKKLLVILASMAPYKPNIENLAKQIGSTRDTLLKYFDYLHKAKLINLVNIDPIGINYMNKPDKIYLENPNLSYVLNPENINIGTARETFILNQLINTCSVTLHNKGDFLIDKKYIVEVGGKNKLNKQIAGLENAYIVSDDIEFGQFNRIPLWLFGFLY